MKFKRGQLVTTLYRRPCIVLGRIRASDDRDIWYKVYMIEHQRTISCHPSALSTMNPQEAESEV